MPGYCITYHGDLIRLTDSESLWESSQPPAPSELALAPTMLPTQLYQQLVDDYQGMPVFLGLSQHDCLSWLAERWNIAIPDRLFPDDMAIRTPDPEDDRIVIWALGPRLQAVWHCSGWHWNGDADDLPGGPLSQGQLSGMAESLYSQALSP